MTDMTEGAKILEWEPSGSPSGTGLTLIHSARRAAVLGRTTCAPPENSALELVRKLDIPKKRAANLIYYRQSREREEAAAGRQLINFPVYRLGARLPPTWGGPHRP